MRKPFKESLYEKLIQLFRATGMAFEIPKLDKIRNSSEEIADLISKEATIQAIDLLEKVQERVLSAVEQLEDKLNNIEDRLDGLERQNQLDKPIKISDN